MNSTRLKSWVIWLWTLFLSSLVGIAATASDLTTLFVLMRAFGLDEKIANIPSLLPGLVVMFVGNKYFAFGDSSRQIVRQGSLFLLIEFFAFLLNIILFDVLVRFVQLQTILAQMLSATVGLAELHAAVPESPFMIIRMIGTAVTYFIFSFPLWATFVFRRPSEIAQPAVQED